MKKWLFTILVGVVLVLGACGGGDNNNNDVDNNNGNNNDVTETTSAGEEAYRNSCANCHGNNLSDGSAPDLSAIGAKYSAEEIEDIIENGIGGMPPQRQVSESDRAEIANWLAQQQ